MGTGCCGKGYQEDENLLQKTRSVFNRSIKAQFPQIKRNYISLPNQFTRKINWNSQQGVTGLQNQGSTCYINVVLQCLSSVQPLTDYFLSGVFMQDLNPQSSELIKAYGQLLLAIWTQDFQIIRPIYIVNLIRELRPQFSEGLECDAQQFMSHFLDFLHQQLNRSQKIQIQDQKTENSDQQLEVQAALAWGRHLQFNSSVIVDLFQGQLKSTVKCLRCQKVSVTFDTFMYLSIPVRHQTLQKCLQEFTKQEVLENNGCVCKYCQTVYPISKKIDIWKLPPVLMIMFKRFEYIQGKSRKIHQNIKYNMKNLRLNKLVSGPQKGDVNYFMFAQINHHGEPEQGHYTSFAKNRVNQKWYFYNDEKTHRVYDQQVLSSQAYILFYHSDSQQYYRQSLNCSQNWPHIINKLITLKTEEQDLDSTNLASGHSEKE